MKRVPLTSLVGPTIKSHPWDKMLAGRTPAVSVLSRYVRDDQYYVEVRSLGKLVELLDAGDLWASHLFNQATQDATTSRLGEKLKRQLAVKTDPLSRPFYDLVVDEVAVTGSDLYLREGSDVTILFRLKQPDVFRARMDGYLKEAQESRPDSRRVAGKILGVDYVSVTTRDRAVNVCSAYPLKDLHVRSNSLAALERTIAAIQGKTADGKPVSRLGESDEFKYIRTLMPDGAAEEDAFVYLSDPFIRRVVGPELKLKERRRMLAYNHLRMIGHAGMMFRTEFGRGARSLEELAQTKCAPGVFGAAELACPLNGGTYELGSDGLTAFCSSAGNSRDLIPTLEIPLEEVTQEEADEYQDFLQEYNSYWRTYFDPIAIRLRMQPHEYRVETIVLPLIDNSIYRGLSSFLGGPPEPLDSLPVPKGNIFSMALKLNKDDLAKSAEDLLEGVTRDVDASGAIEADFVNFMHRGLGSQIGVHVYDAPQLFEFNLTGFLGQALGSFNNWSNPRNELLPVSLLIASLNSPVYVSIPVADAKIVDDFLKQIDKLAAVQARQRRDGFFWFEIDTDFYRLKSKPGGPETRAFVLQFGPLKWRFFVARINKGLYIATKPFILDDLVAADAAQGKPGAEKTATAGRRNPTAHAMLRVRPENWNKVLDDFRLGWAENNREACLNNLGPLSNVARAHAADPGRAKLDLAEAMNDIQAEAENLYGVRYFCPEGGKFILAPDRVTVTSSAFGSLLEPRQDFAPSPTGDTAQILDDFGGVTAELTFLEDGLHAVLTIERKKK